MSRKSTDNHSAPRNNTSRVSTPIYDSPAEENAPLQGETLLFNVGMVITTLIGLLVILFFFCCTKRRPRLSVEERKKRNAAKMKEIEPEIQENRPVLPNCEHDYCCDCVIQQWQNGESIDNACICALCRRTVSKLLLLRFPTNEEKDSHVENDLSLKDLLRRIPSTYFEILRSMFRSSNSREFLHRSIILSYWPVVMMFVFILTSIRAISDHFVHVRRRPTNQ